MTKYRLVHPACEVCGGTNPRRNNDVHHIVPWAAVRVTKAENLITLCPEHHKTAHHVGVFVSKRHFGPKDKASLVTAIREARDYPIPRAILEHAFDLARSLR